MAQRYVKVFYNWPEGTSALTDAEKGRLIDAMVAYARGDPIRLEGNESFVFPIFKAQIDRDSEKYGAIVARNQANGSKGGRPKKNPDGFSGTQTNPENPDGFSETQKSQEQEQEQEQEQNKPPISPKGESASNYLFDLFWAAYPRKVAKQAAVKAWGKIKPDEAFTRKIIAAVDRFREDPQWRKDDGQFIPHPATFLNGRRWEDEPNREKPPEDPRAFHDMADIENLYGQAEGGLT